MNSGLIVGTLIGILIVAFAMFLVTRGMNDRKREDEVLLDTG